MTSIALGPILLVVICIFIVFPIVLICVLLGRQNRAPSSASAEPAAPSNPKEHGRRREAILEKLATKTITREEAEQELLELDRPLPEHMPSQPRANKGCGLGCLIGVIVMVALFFLLFLLFFVFGVSSSGTTIH